jgi:predicted AAA+ superfamily ATPase
MKEEYQIHNQYWSDPEAFLRQDPHLSQLEKLKFVHPLDWWRDIQWDQPGIYILTGGRQIGKSTSTKLLIQHAINEKIFSCENMFYFPCDQIDEHHQLSRVIRSFLEGVSKKEFLLVLDEITFVRDWDRAIKALADEGHFRTGFCILTGSDSVILKQAGYRFPGRRGEADRPDFELHPLDFHQFVELTQPALLDQPDLQIEKLFSAFDRYLICGGYLKAINEFWAKGELSQATTLTYEQWIKGDFSKRGKKTRYLEEVLTVLYQTASSQVTYTRLAQKTAGMSSDTLIDYCQMLLRMGIICILEAFDQNTLKGHLKKARKIHFADPFIAEVVGRWLERERYIDQKLAQPAIVESVVAANLSRHFPAYYIKAAGEIDLVVVKDRSFRPIEVKWGNQIRPRDFNQVKKYPNSVILTKQLQATNLEGVATMPLPLFLLSQETVFK